MSKPELLESIRSGYLLFKELLAEIDAERVTQPGAIGKWSVKDAVAHIVAHEQRMIAWMIARLRGECPLAPQPYSMPQDELDALNEEIYLENRDRSLDEIMRDLEQAHAEVLIFVEEAAAENILDPRCFQLQRGEPLWEAIAANTFWHYEEHGRDIRGWQEAVRDKAR